MSIGEKFSPILAEIEDALWEHEAIVQLPPGFTDQGFRAILKIFMAAAMDRMWRLQKNEKMSLDDRAAMARRLGKDMRQLVKTYTDTDAHDLYK